MNSKSTATVTWISWNNFGSLLQAYALQKTVESLGYSNIILDDSRIVKKMSKRASFKQKIKKYFHCTKEIIFGSKVSYFNEQYQQVEKLFDNFRNSYLNIDRDWSEADIGIRYKEYICGSDQIWAPSKSNSMFYFLKFTDRKKIAYSVSIGSDKLPKYYIKRIKPYIRRFAFISVREKYAKDVIQPFTTKPVCWTLDPTLLLSAKDWYEIATGPFRKSDRYILIYLLTYNSVYVKLIKDFAKNKGMKTKILVSSPNVNYQDFDEVIYAGPAEFLSAIACSTFFFTDSFHGTIFSLLFHKKFFTLKRFFNSVQNKQDYRIESLFRLLDLYGYFYGEMDFENVYKQGEINYNEIDSKLDKARAISISLLAKAMK